MNQEPDKNLERLISERLRALPELRAPENLIPDVMRIIAAQSAKVWWRSPWLEWPRGMQILSFVLLAAVLGTAWYFSDAVSATTGNLTGQMTGNLSFLKPVWTLVATLMSALRLVVSSIKTEYIVAGVSIIAALYLATVGLGTLCYRLATGRNPSL